MTPPTAADLGAAIRQACKDAGITQKQIAQATAKDQSTISAWMNGENWAALGSLPIIDDLCGKPAGYILRLAGFVEPDTSVPAAIAADPLLDDSGRELVAMAYDYCVQAALNADRPSVMPSRAVQEAEAAADKATAERLAAEREPNHSPSAAAG